MDIYSFVNSKDISEYLRKIEYSFNSLEAAWLIYTSHNLSYEKKKAAWLELIETMPDCEVPKRNNCAGWDSLHEMLRQYMEVVDKELSDFYKNDSSKKYVYMYSYLYKGDKSWTEEYETIYVSLEACCDALREDIADMDVTYSSQSTGVLKYRLKKQSLVDTQIVAELEFNGNGDFEGIMRHNPGNEEIDKILNYSFEGLWFDFPTPFKKGDIVWVPPCCGQMRYDGGFVLNGLSTWNPAEYMIQSGDNTDMNGCGYFVNPDGTVYYEVMSNYMDLEYYNGPYKVNEKILPALSKFVKGEIEIDLLLCVYRKVLLDVVGDDSILKSWYSKEILEELGFK